MAMTFTDTIMNPLFTPTDRPFAGVTISDSLVTVTDSVTITLLDSTGKALASDANGTLTGAGLTKSSPGVYTLAANTPAIITTELNALSFHPIGTAPVTTGFRLAVTDAGDNPTTATDSKTSVIEQTPPPLHRPWGEEVWAVDP